MEIDLSVEVVPEGGSASSNSANGRLLWFKRIFSTKKKRSTCMLVVPESINALEEPVIDVIPETFIPVPAEVPIENQPSYLLRVGRVLVLIVRFLSLALGIIGGLYVILPMCCRDDSHIF